MTPPLITAVSRRYFTNSVIAVAVTGFFSVQMARAADKADPAIEATVGKEFTITLDSNRTTGFGWQLAKSLDETMVKSVRNEYQDARKASDKQPMMGAPGREVWTFKALKPGNTIIEFKYVRPWEKDIAPAKTKSVAVVVKAGK